MLWGWRLVRIEGKMDAEVYRAILSENLFLSVFQRGSRDADILTRQEKHPKHAAEKTHEWLQENSVISAEISLTDLVESERFCQEEQEELQGAVPKLGGAFPRRLKAVIAAKVLQPSTK